MTLDTDGDKRRVYALRPVASLLPSVTRPALRRHRAATAQIILDWEAIVGPVLAAQSVPKKLFAGTLSVSCIGPMALELQHLSAALMERINCHVGHATVTRMRFVQDLRLSPRPEIRSPRPLALRAAAAAVATVPEGPLRDALERLGRSVLTD